MQTDHRSGRTILAILVLPVLTVAFLWIPFGFSLGGLVEEWGFLELFARKGVFYIITDATLQAQKARPLHVLPQALAYTLDPDSFLFWHLILAAALTVKAVSAGGLSRCPRLLDHAFPGGCDEQRPSQTARGKISDG
jgi:hypothetical protein